jgi:hypothetical protein
VSFFSPVVLLWGSEFTGCAGGLSQEGRPMPDAATGELVRLWA